MAESRANAKSVTAKYCLGAKKRNKRARLNYVASVGKSPENSLDILAAAAAMAMEYPPQLEEKDQILTEVLSFLPDDLAEEIFLWLPLKSVIKFRCLSKFWYGKIVHPSFIQKYHCDENEECYPASFMDKTSGKHSTVLGSCDGFYCYATWWLSVDIYLYNPSIRRAIKIPYYPFRDVRGLGVGYEDSTDDVKLVKISNKDGSTMIYSPKENTWETINDVCPDSIVHKILFVFMRGSIYWCGETTIVAFDLSQNVFRQIPYPGTHGSRLTYCSLSVVKGSLCFMPRPRGDDYFWIYKLKQEENGWEEIYQGRGPEKGSIGTFGLTGECNILVRRLDVIGCRIMLFAYDIQTKQEEFIRYGKRWFSWVSIKKKSLQLLHYPGQYLHPHEFT